MGIGSKCMGAVSDESVSGAPVSDEPLFGSGDKTKKPGENSGLLDVIQLGLEPRTPTLKVLCS
ncbi:MAG: hypothetical protein RR339_10645, partial [Bacteroidales bacterium]